MSNVTLTPIDLSDATAIAGNRFRKQILKFGSINYKGRKITFDKPFLSKIVRSFNDGAYDQVPFVLADASNGHNMDPEKFRGSVVGMELTDDGLDAIIEATEGGAKVIKDNPRLGVSARIVADLTKSDGRKFPLAIQHVLATMDPRVTGMRPWQTVTDLSNDEDTDPPEIVDLSAHPFIKEKNVPRIAKKTTSVPAKAKKPADRKPKKSTAPVEDGNVDLSNLSDEEFQALLDLTTDEETVEDDEDDEDEDLDEDEDEESEDDDESDEDEENDEDEEEDDEEVPAPKVSLSKKTSRRDKNVIDLAHQVLKRDRARLAAREWKADKREYAAAGVPPFLLDLATPIMLADEEDLATFDLSHEVKGKKRTLSLGTRDIVKKMLDGMKGMVDLSEDLGHQVTVGKDDPDAGALAAWEREYGKA